MDASLMRLAHFGRARLDVQSAAGESDDNNKKNNKTELWQQHWPPQTCRRPSRCASRQMEASLANMYNGPVIE